jgi:acyl carrier protein
VSLVQRIPVVSPVELAELVIQAVGLENVRVDDVNLDGPIYRDGLGLDSLDMLEVVLTIQQRYGVKIRAEDPETKHVFSSLRSLAEYINAAQT